ncbi:hypothetical protein [Geoalkalibacter sp.]|uniref:hypothetical protein n=1 Tax=Geoalkalibacter sp. TaxID=3041440 RepID=UPI00272E2D4F|nr:hypothetical protein [Geoalkalibacter sp.]
MNLTCPSCYATHALEAYVQTDAQRELLAALVKAPPEVFRPLVSYLGLFRPPSRALAPERALRLVGEVLALCESSGSQALAAALVETVEALRRKREQGQLKPLKNHNYLKQVLSSAPPAPVAFGPDQVAGTPAPRGKRAQAMQVLAQWAGDDWLRRELASGLCALLADNRQGAPAADSVVYTAGLWETLLREAGVTIEAVDAARIRRGFKLLLTDFSGWPEARDLRDRLGKRPERAKLDEPPPSPEQREAARAAMRKIQQGL